MNQPDADQTRDDLPATPDETDLTQATGQDYSIDQTLDSLPPDTDRTLASNSDGRPADDDGDDFSLRQQTDQSQETARFDGDVERIGRYQVRRVLGEGAFGCVFEAYDPQLDRVVAIKVAKSLDTSNDIERFLREARSAAQLRHPRIIPVHEYGRVDGKHIIVYEFIEGETLKSYMQRNQPMQLDDALRLVRLIAEGLDYAHSKGIIHRDMKPDNVMIDGEAQPHIADFGCARSLDADVSLTMDGSILGTPTYMSPEQASGRSNMADGRTDIWSLGVMLYEMVSGQKPFSGKLSDLLFWIRTHDPPALRKVHPPTPIDVETICTKCLQRDLVDRFPDAQTLADEIERFQRGEPILSRPIGVLRRTVLWSKRNPAVASLLGLVAVTLLLGITFSSWFAIDARNKQIALTQSNMKLLTTARPSQLPVVYESLKLSSQSVLSRLNQRLEVGEESPHDIFRLRAAVLNLTDDDAIKAELSKLLSRDLLVAGPDSLGVNEFMIGRQSLVESSEEIPYELWPIALDREGDRLPDERFRAACLLSKLDPDAAAWADIATDAVGVLSGRDLIELGDWLEAIRPVRDALLPALRDAYHQPVGTNDVLPDRAAALLAKLFPDRPALLVELVETASTNQLNRLQDSLVAGGAEVRAAIVEQLAEISESTIDPDQIIAKTNLVIALIQLGDQQQWNHLNRNLDVSVAVELIERLGPSIGLSDTPQKQLASALTDWQNTDEGTLSGLVLSMGQFSLVQISESQRQALSPLLLQVFLDHPDSGVHSATRWLLDRWGKGGEIHQAETGLRRPLPEPGKRWHVDLAGNTFAIFDPVERFSMGTSADKKELVGDEAADTYGESQHFRSIPRRFGICIHEVSEDSYRQFAQALVDRWQAELDELEQPTEAPEIKKLALQLKARIKAIDRRQVRYADNVQQAPVVEVDFYKALGYCRWLSDQQKTGACVISLNKLQEKYDDGTDFLISHDHIKRAGYRLPTSGEWEYACRAGSTKLHATGVIPERIATSAWYAEGSSSTLQVIGQLKPNGFGLFDMQGNASEWCLNWYREWLPELPGAGPDHVWVDFGKNLEGWRSEFREYRGGSYKDLAEELRPAKRFFVRPFKGLNFLGIRLARTYPD